jgi:hypothetical protein
LLDDKLLRAAREAGLEAEASEAALADRANRRGAGNPDLRFYLAVLGVLPWVGVLITAAIGRWAEADQTRVNDLHRIWLAEHEARFEELEADVVKIASAAAAAGEAAHRRLNDDAYLSLVRLGFRVWDRSENSDKRALIRKTLSNAACDSLCTDDFVRRFIEWIDSYNELHFKIVRCLFTKPGSTRLEIWQEIHGAPVREDSAQADLFRLLMRDLSTGGVIRQARDTTSDGRFLKKHRARSTPSRVTKSSFDNEDQYLLTELGEDFVHYALNEVVPRLTKGGASEPSPAQGS